MAAEEPVTSPDQHKPTPVKAARIAGVLTIVALLLMLVGNHDDGSNSYWVENAWLIATAGVLAAILIVDAVLRRNGLRD